MSHHTAVLVLSDTAALYVCWSLTERENDMPDGWT